jgi:biopolymer transport protein ExbD
MAEFGTDRQGLNVDVNLVPFVDLLSVCICFLLMAAVWLQVSAVEVKQSHGTIADPDKNGYEYNVYFRDRYDVKFVMTKAGKKAGGFVVQAENAEQFHEQLAIKLDESLLVAKKPNPEEPPIDAAMITPSKKTPYGSMMMVMDMMRKRKIVNLAVVPTRG